MRAALVLAVGCLIACSGPNAGPIAVIDADVVSGPLPLTVSLSASQSEGADLTYTWDLGNAPPLADAKVSYTWLGSGSTTVALTVEDPKGRTASDTVDIEVVGAECPREGLQKELGRVTAPELTEISGLAVSQLNPGVVWVHNDARNVRALYALDEAGALLGEFVVDIDHGDWEDIAIGTDDAGEPVIFVGSVGNNDFDREVLSVLVVPEPLVPLGVRNDGTLDHHEMVVQYPDGTYDAESLMWDPQTGALFVLTKDAAGPANLFRAEAPHDNDMVALAHVASFDFDADPLSGRSTTGAAISPLGDLIVVRTYSNIAYVWRRDASEPFLSAFDGVPCPVTLISEPQGESIDFGLDGRSLLTISEGTSPSVNRTRLK